MTPAFVRHCGQRMLMRHGVRLSPRCADLLDMIEHSGTRGVPEEILVSVFYPDKSTRDAKNCVKVNVSHINNYLQSTDVRVVKNRDEPYRVVCECGSPTA